MGYHWLLMYGTKRHSDRYIKPLAHRTGANGDEELLRPFGRLVEVQFRPILNYQTVSNRRRLGGAGAWGEVEDV